MSLKNHSKIWSRPHKVWIQSSFICLCGMIDTNLRTTEYSSQPLSYSYSPDAAPRDENIRCSVWNVARTGSGVQTPPGIWSPRYGDEDCHMSQTVHASSQRVSRPPPHSGIEIQPSVTTFITWSLISVSRFVTYFLVWSPLATTCVMRHVTVEKSSTF